MIKDPLKNVRKVYKKYPHLCHNCKEDSCTCFLRIEDGTVGKYSMELNTALSKDMEINNKEQKND